ncbi:leucine-rich repeat-containing G-protein coupled receptor 4-like [Lutzomyia longipalpis]|uniref:leucine-rich repeat-containing G-protein coupled receptor 4-like n=1 Tax=Lutzomyia longipalpis TaxID=7200 RepID=UPI0024840C1A|nr:leucine-rich repeat-containing G-protein coupled receptor 4-like [Lutzomyia longipalpis]
MSHVRQINGNKTLNGAKNLKILDLSRNSLEEIEDFVFSEGKELVKLHLSRNKIISVGLNAFTGLEKLELLDLSFNTIKILQGEIFSGFTKLKFIYVNNNAIQSMKINLNKCSNLLEFDGSYNNIIEWNLLLSSPKESNVIVKLSNANLKNSLTSASNKDELIVDGNSLDYVNIKGKLRRLSAKNNKIRYIEIKPDIAITTLELAGNMITNIENITKIWMLEKLDLSENPLSQLNVSTFSLLDDLRTLNLRSTGISVDQNYFTAQKKLTFLDISANGLTSLNLKNLKSLTSLQTLYLHENKLIELENIEDIKKILPSLTTISLAKNRFSCSYISKILTILNNLNISVQVSTKDLATINTNVLGIDCILLNNDDKGNSSDLEEMIILQKNAKDLANRCFENVNIQLTENIQNLTQILNDGYFAFKDLLNMSTNLKDEDVITNDNIPEMNYTKILSEEIFKRIDNLPDQFNMILKNYSMQSSVDNMDFTFWEYFALYAFLCAMLQCLCFGLFCIYKRYKSKSTYFFSV